MLDFDLMSNWAIMARSFPSLYDSPPEQILLLEKGDLHNK
jgi:hypothetical protein